MKAAHLVLQVALIGVALFLYDAIRGDYDAIRGDPPSTQEAGALPRPAPMAPAEAADRATATPGLVGIGEAAWRAEMERRLDRLEGRETLPAPGEVPVQASGAEAEAGNGLAALDLAGLDAEAASLEEEEVDGEGVSRRFTPGQIATFRALLETVERQQRRERAERGIERLLDRADVQLTPAQRQEVVKATLAFQERRNEVFRSLAEGGTDREDRRAAAEDLRTQYRTTLEALVPAAEADRILESLSRPGGGGDRRRPPGPPAR